MDAQSEIRVKPSKVYRNRSLSTGDFSESRSIAQVHLQKITTMDKKFGFEILKQQIESIDKKLGKLLVDVKKIKQSVRNQNSSSNTLRFSSKLGKKTMVWRGRSKTGQKQRESRSERDDENKQNKGENADRCLQLLLMMMNFKGDPLKHIKMEDRTRTKSELMSLPHDRKDSLFGDAFDGTLAKTRMQNEHRKTLLESFMYHDYHNGFSAEAKKRMFVL